MHLRLQLRVGTLLREIAIRLDIARSLLQQLIVFKLKFSANSHAVRGIAPQHSDITPDDELQSAHCAQQVLEQTG